jgi:hypothetical protein
MLYLSRVAVAGGEVIRCGISQVALVRPTAEAVGEACEGPEAR